MYALLGDTNTGSGRLHVCQLTLPDVGKVSLASGNVVRASNVPLARYRPHMYGAAPTRVAFFKKRIDSTMPVVVGVNCVPSVHGPPVGYVVRTLGITLLKTDVLVALVTSLSNRKKPIIFWVCCEPEYNIFSGFHLIAVIQDPKRAKDQPTALMRMARRCARVWRRRARSRKWKIRKLPMPCVRYS
jgi:hypothetical protein